MPTSLSVDTVKTIKEFTTLIEKKLAKSNENTLWFRGVGMSSYSLSPTLHRHSTITTPEDVVSLETRIIDRFNQRSIPFITNSLNRKDDWEVLFYMQHYAMPTRLLDWSENPFVALYFALTSAPFKVIDKKRVYEEDCSVWVLDPIVWNQESLKDFSYDGGILSTEDPFVDSFKPRTPYVNIREKPVAIFGTHNSSRIVSQRGVFTVFGKRIQPMEEIYKNDSFPEGCLQKVDFPKDKIVKLLESLAAIGITDSVIYPDLEGFAKETKRFFKFDI